MDILSMKAYDGVCHACNSPVFFEDVSGEIIREDDMAWLIKPETDKFHCPNCKRSVEFMIVYKSMNVTGEFANQLIEGSHND